MRLSAVMPGFFPGIHVLTVSRVQRRGWQGQARPSRRDMLDYIALCCVVTAVDQEVGAGHEARRVARKKDRSLCDFAWLA